MKFSRAIQALAGLCLLGWVLEGQSQPPRSIRVVLDSGYAPYTFESSQGEAQGILVDQWKLWEKKTGINVHLFSMDWATALSRTRAGDFDVIDTIVQTAERGQYFDFTPPYATIEVPVFFRRGISGITDIPSLKGFTVGMKLGDQHIEKLRAQGITTLITYENYEAMIEAAKRNQINVFVADAPAALYLLHKAGIEREFKRSLPIFRDHLQRAVAKGNTALLNQIVAGFAAIPPKELERIDEKWFGVTAHWTSPYVAYAGCATGAAILLALGLAAWNRRLKQELLKGTVALRESEQRFRQIAENIDGVFWLTTADFGQVLYISPAYERFWGCKIASLQRNPRSFLEAIHPEDRSRAVASLSQAASHGCEVEYRIVRPDGSVRWIRDRRFPIKDPAEAVYRIAAVTDDITERKLADETVKQADDRVRLIIDTIPIMAWTVRPDGAVDFVNKRWTDYTGISLEAEIKTPSQAIHPDDMPGAIRKWLDVIATGEEYEAEMRLRRADGEYHWFLIRTVPLRDGAGKIVKWYGTSTDIDERKQSERQSLMLIDAIPQQIWSGPRDGSIDFCNERWRAYTGLQLEELHGDGWQQIIHPDDRKFLLTAWLSSVANGIPFELEARHRAKDGTHRWFLVRAVPSRDAQGRIMRWYGTNTDIEDRKIIEKMLRDSGERLRALSARLESLLEEERIRIAREIHDELGQTLTGLKMDLLRAERMTEALESSPAANALLDTLVGATELTDGISATVQEIATALRPGVLDKLGLGAALQYEARRFRERTGLLCETRLPEPEYPLTGEISTTLFRIFQECLTNVARHARATKVHALLKIEEGWVILRVEDDGRGITDAELLNPASLGLLGMKERAALMKGLLSFERGLERGTIVTARLLLE